MASTSMLSAAREHPHGGSANNGNRYEVIERLGAGGMGVVFRVLDHVTGEQRALKRATLGEQGRRHLAAFEREFLTLASLDHPRIIRVFDYGIDEHGPYYTMELLDGEDMRRAAPLPFTRACLCLRDVATSLALLHARRLLHRDVSPGNVRLSTDGHCKLLDFGALASFGPNSTIVGTPPMMAPELLDGAAIDQRVDLFALGALAYWMLTGRHAYPAHDLAELRVFWLREIPAPSYYVADIPSALDALVLSLLRLDPLARPQTAAEVIAQLELIGELPLEALADSKRLAQSFLLRPRFIGRARELGALSDLLQNALRGAGALTTVVSTPGVGRSRVLDELCLRAQLSGALVLRADASMSRQLNGVARALTLSLYASAPELARSLAAHHRDALSALGSDVAARFGVPPRAANDILPPADAAQQRAAHALESLFLEVARHKAVLVAVDDIEYADDASAGMLASLSDACAQHAIMIALSELEAPENNVGSGLAALHSRSKVIQLSAFSKAETQELIGTLFGRAPNSERFSSWLHTHTAGIPLYALELCRQLTERGIIRYARGAWTLPGERPEDYATEGLADAMAARLARLSEPARALAECLSLQVSPPSRELCRLLVPDGDAGKWLELLAELTRHDVLVTDGTDLSFSSDALRRALITCMDERRRQENHRRLGEALRALPEQSPAVRLQAGWHLIEGDDAVRGADIIAEVAADGVSVVKLSLDLHRNATVIESALLVYARQRYSLYRRLPLLALLAYSSFYEDRIWGDRYGDQALDALEDLCGLRSARQLRPWLGRWLSAMAGFCLAYLRFCMTRKSDRPYSFYRLFVLLSVAVSALAGTAALSLDVERTRRVAATLEPFVVFSSRLSLVGVYQFCRSLEQIGLENQPEACAGFDALLSRFQDKRYYPSLSSELRRLYMAPLWFASGAFATFRADGALALRRADELDALGFKFYSMIASQIRYLYYMFRGEIAKAAPHRTSVELHAAQVGSAWQVETWECPAMILLYTYMLDTVEGTRLVHRLETLSRRVPPLRRYLRLAVHALMVARDPSLYAEELLPEYTNLPARSYIGWAATVAYFARALNDLGRHEKAKRVCEDALSQLNDAHREYVTLFLALDLQLACADAALGDHARALARLNMLLERFKACDHPLLLGSIHEARARVCWSAGDLAGYHRSLKLVNFHFRGTGTPTLIAKCEQLALLSRDKTLTSARTPPTEAGQQHAQPDRRDRDPETQTVERRRSEP